MTRSADANKLVVVSARQGVGSLRENFAEALSAKKVVCLHRPDVYRYMETALIEELKAALSGHVEMPE